VEDNAKLTQLAQIMIDKHGEHASAIARINAIRCSAEPEVAVIWSRVADLIESYQSHVVDRVERSDQPHA
jgi:DNA-binding transcriptional regulator YdaS (Cro superfamily)